MDNYGMRQEAMKWARLSEEIELVDMLYHDGRCFEQMVEIFVETFDCKYSFDEAEILVSEILQAAS